MQRKLKNGLGNGDGSNDIVCPHCTMTYSFRKIVEAQEPQEQPQIILETNHPDFYGEANQLSGNIYRCASCNRLFAVNLRTHHTRPLNYHEQKRFNKYGMTKNMRLIFNHLEAAYLGLEQFSTIEVTQFDAERGVLYFVDAFGNECEVELMPMILKSFIIDNSADDKVKDAIMQAIRTKRMSDRDYSKESKEILQEEYRRKCEYEHREMTTRMPDSHYKTNIAYSKIHTASHKRRPAKTLEEQAHQYGRH